MSTVSDTSIDSPLPKRVRNLSAKVRTPFKSPLRTPLTPNSSGGQECRTPSCKASFTSSPCVTPTYKTPTGSGNHKLSKFTPNRPRALKRKSFSFNSPLKVLKVNSESLLAEDIDSLEKEIVQQVG